MSLVKIKSEKNNKFTTELFDSGLEKSKLTNKDTNSIETIDRLLFIIKIKKL